MLSIRQLMTFYCLHPNLSELFHPNDGSIRQERRRWGRGTRYDWFGAARALPAANAERPLRVRKRSVNAESSKLFGQVLMPLM
jgi:hypothetical protein